MYCKPRKTRNTYRGRAATTTKEKRCFPVNRVKLTNTTLVTGEQRYEDLYTTFRSEYPRCLHGFDRICFRGTRHFLAQYGPVCLVSCGSGKGFAKSGLGPFHHKLSSGLRSALLGSRVQALAEFISPYAGDVIK